MPELQGAPGPGAEQPRSGSEQPRSGTEQPRGAPGRRPVGPVAGGGQAAFHSLSGSDYRLDSPLRFATVSALRPQGLALIAAASAAVTLDLSSVPSADSAGLALLIDWLAAARAAHKTLRYVHLPQDLLALARLSDVERLLTA